jgi:hypothetical protein
MAITNTRQLDVKTTLAITLHRCCCLSEKHWAKKKEAAQKSAERKYKKIRDKVIPELKQRGHVLPQPLQQEIKVWEGNYNGTFIVARQLTTPAEITTTILIRGR